MLQLGIHGIQIRPDSNLSGSLETPPIDKRGYRWPHTLHVVEEDIHSQVSQSFEPLDEISDIGAAVVGL